MRSTIIRPWARRNSSNNPAQGMQVSKPSNRPCTKDTYVLCTYARNKHARLALLPHLGPHTGPTEPNTAVSALPAT